MDNYKFIFCTVITNSHKYLAETLFASLKRNCEVGYTVILYVLVTDSALDKNCDNLEIIYLNLETINDVPFAEEIINKYQNVNDDFLRWSLKPILLRYVVTNLAKNTIYVDSDVFFFDNYKFLFDKFLDYDCMLSPHFRTLEPKVWPLNFEKNFTDGLYNGGFFGIGSNSNSKSILDWWAQACAYKCTTQDGLFHDQKYLDLIPVRFENTFILKHQGCNVATWNITDFKRTVLPNKKVLINDIYPVIFVHFAFGTCIDILTGIDEALIPYFRLYENTMQPFKKGLYGEELLNKFNMISQGGGIQKPSRTVLRRAINFLRRKLTKLKMFNYFLKKIDRIVRPDCYKPKPISVGILYICVGKYDRFFDNFYASFKKFFLPNTHKKYFVFTDSAHLKNKYANHKDIIFISTEKKGWPYDTLLRNYYFRDNLELLASFNFIFFCNANLICKTNVLLDELGLVANNLCGVVHPSFFVEQKENYPVETKLGNARFNKEEMPFITHYFQGCFYGGNLNAFSDLVLTISHWMDEDLQRNIIPVWHDESYLNRYFFINNPYPLHPGFSYPEYLKFPFTKKILQLSKDNHNLR